MLDPIQREAEFPGLSQRSYLNTAAEGIPPLSSLDAFRQYQEDKLLGMDGREHLFQLFNDARSSAANLLSLSAEEISFCSSTSEAYNLLASAVEFPGNSEAVITNLDFPSGATPWLRHPDKPIVQLWEHQNGVLKLDDLNELLNERTRLVQVSLVSFLTGYRIEWEPFRDLVRQLAPSAVLAVDVTQAAGRIELDCLDADCLFASGYKWLLGSHGSCLIAIPKASCHALTVRAGGWYHLANAFDEDRFERAESFPGAAGFAVGMPSFPAIYSLKHGIDFLRSIGVGAIATHADRLVSQLHEGLQSLGVKTMSPHQPENSSGIVSFLSASDAELNAFLRKHKIHVMHQAGRMRVAVHGYNTEEDIAGFLGVLKKFS
ncbi:MAG: aminotransferase class V-fold PLP-dependent enzyme [Verrucomicrobiales bacterium]|nr:aminotransferase class V-fold PLP-dependent enzyme [Verrucomicrobiales bacterium]